MNKILIDRSTVEQALEALEGWENHDRWVWPESALEQAKRNTTEALAALRAALAEPVQEPAPMPPFPPVSLWKRGCAVCGIGAGGHAYGYACPRSDCPTRVTCGGTV